MAKKKDIAQGDKSLGGIESALTRSEQFIEDNQKLLTNVLIGALAAVLLIVAGNRYILKPKNAEAAEAMYMAERFFEQDSFNLALNGYGTYPGFLDVMDEYSITKSAKLSKYYAGVCYKELGDFATAEEYLSKYKTKDILIGSSALSSLGDVYAELQEYDKSVKVYQTAIDKYENSFSTPIILKKAGIVYEATGDLEGALKVYKQISSEYPTSAEGREIKKYIGRVEAKMAVK